MPRYVDGFVIPIPKKNLAAYKRMAALGARVWRDHGALDYYETVGDDLAPKGMPGVAFTKLARTKPNETVVFAFIVFRSRAHRDRVNAKVMQDPRMHAFMEQMKGEPMPFDFKRMAYGGFRVLVQR